MSHWQDAFSETNIHYTRTGGDGPPLLLAHGFTDYGLVWTRTAQALEDEYQIIMPDARGHGRSSSRDDDHTSAQYADDLAALIDELQIGPVFAVGHSMGAVNVFYFAARHPDLVRRVVLIDPPWRPPGEGRSPEMWERWRNHVVQLKAMSLDERLEQYRKDRPTWQEIDIEQFARAIVEFDINCFERMSLPNQPWQEVLSTITCPVLLMTPDEGGIKAETAAEAQQINPGLQHARVANSGHNIVQDQFDDFMLLLRQFLKET